MKVAYMPPIMDIGPYPQHIQLILSVTNHLGRTVTGICFNITVVPVDNQPPQVEKKIRSFLSHFLHVVMWIYKKKCAYVLFQVITNPLTVDEGGECWLGPDHLLLSDVDSMEEALRVQLQREPQHGALQLGGLPLKAGHVFTVQDLKSFKVRSDILLHSCLLFFKYEWRQIIRYPHFNLQFHHSGTITIAQKQSRTTLNSLQLMATIQSRLSCK